ncbi:hypothetical protein [Georgenia sp. Z1491]|uniref:hypothetical protein n=1 Tax=Georgenia sp. Z1491 TaxID=3416707 RepID=UPI003CEA74DC
MTTGNDPLDNWGPDAPVHRETPAAAPPGAGARPGAVPGARPGAGPSLEARRRSRLVVVSTMAVTDLAIVLVGLLFFEPPTQWVVVAVGVLGLGVAAYMWNMLGRQIRGLEEDERERGANPHYPDA